MARRQETTLFSSGSSSKAISDKIRGELRIISIELSAEVVTTGCASVREDAPRAITILLRENIMIEGIM